MSRQWESPRYWVRIAEQPYEVDLGCDSDGDGYFVSTLKVLDGQCACGDGEWSFDSNGLGDEWIVCVCGNRYELHYGVPPEYMGEKP